MAETLYSIDILRLAASTGRWPRLAAPDGTAERRSVTCGSRVRVDVSLDADGAIAALGLDVSACALGQAACALMAAHGVGRTHGELAAAADALAAYLEGRADSLPDWPGIAALAPARDYPARHPSILLAFQTAADALADAVAHPDGQRAHG